jgi:CHAT domain-containing protein
VPAIIPGPLHNLQRRWRRGRNRGSTRVTHTRNHTVLPCSSCLVQVNVQVQNDKQCAKHGEHRCCSQIFHTASGELDVSDEGSHTGVVFSMYHSASENGDRSEAVPKIFFALLATCRFLSTSAPAACRSFPRKAFLTYLFLLPVTAVQAQVDAVDREFKRADSLSLRAEYDAALLAFQRLHEALRDSPRRNLFYLSSARIVDTYARMTRFATADSLLLILEPAVRADLGERSKVMADVYRLAGYVRAYQYRYDEAIDYDMRGLAIWRELYPLDSLSHASFQFNLGITYLRKGEAARAREWLLQAAQRQLGHGQVAAAAFASTLQSLGEAEEHLGNLQGCIAMLEQSLRILDSAGMGGSAVGVLGRHQLAVVLRKAGRLEEGLARERSALELARKIYPEQHLNIAGPLAQLGDYCVLFGDFDAATPYYGEAHDIYVALNGTDHASTYGVERKLARLSLLRGNADTAVILYRRVMAAQMKNYGAATPVITSLLCEAGEAFLAAGDARGALQLYARALSLLPAADLMSRADASLGAGNAYNALGRLDSAETWLLQALVLQDSAGAENPELRSATHEAIGNLRVKEGNYAAAIARYESALTALGPAAAQRTQAVRLLLAEAGILRRESTPGREGIARRREALMLYDSAAAAIARGRESYRSEGSKLSAQAELESLCAQGFALAESLLKQTGQRVYREKALAFAERSRAGVLLESLERSGRVKEAMTIPGSRVDTLRLRAAQRERLIDWTARYGDRQAVPALREGLVGIYNAIAACEDSLARTHAGQTALSPRVRIASVTDIQAVLEPGSCMIQFARGPVNLAAFVIGRESFRLIALGKSGPADSLAGDLRRALRTLDRSRYLSAARVLYNRIIAPLAPSLHGFRHLVIVPTGALSYVPFEALIAPDAPGSSGTAPSADRQSPRYLVRDFDISYSVSGTLYCRNRERPGSDAHRGMTFAGFAPVFRTENAVGNKQQHQYIAQLDPLATRSITVDGKQFTELPWSEEEIRAIGDMVAARGGSSSCNVEGDATEDRFKASAAGAGILHIATHGFIDEDNPALSALLFSPSREPASAEDGVLYAGEVYDMHLSADLVVLSSCESGVGRMAPGEGILAMSRGFLSAGARSIAYSLWKVNDRLTGVLMQEFYRHILRGEGYASALSNAKRTMIRNNATANPYFWAGFVLLGDGAASRTLNFPK